MENKKVCTWCKKYKLLSEFREDKKMKCGLNSHCKDCERLRGREYRRKFYQANKEKVKAINKKWNQEHKEQVRAQQLRARRKLRLIILTHYSGGDVKCACCGEKEIKFLCIDHIDNNGAEERRKMKSGKTGHPFYSKLKREGFPKGYQVLCYNCNMAKSFYGECPHKSK